MAPACECRAELLVLFDSDPAVGVLNQPGCRLSLDREQLLHQTLLKPAENVISSGSYIKGILACTRAGKLIFFFFSSEDGISPCLTCGLEMSHARELTATTVSSAHGVLVEWRSNSRL